MEFRRYHVSCARFALRLDPFFPPVLFFFALLYLTPSLFSPLNETPRALAEICLAASDLATASLSALSSTFFFSRRFFAPPPPPPPASPSPPPAVAAARSGFAPPPFAFNAATMWFEMAAIGFDRNSGCASTACIRPVSDAHSRVLCFVRITALFTFLPFALPSLASGYAPPAMSPSVASSDAKSLSAAPTPPRRLPFRFIFDAVATRIFSRNSARFATFRF